jgi:homoserine dehydrogenase
MSKQLSWGLIGYGKIGRELCRQTAQPKVASRIGLRPKPEFILRSKGSKRLDEEALPDVVFVAIPSSEDGQAAYEYITQILRAGKKVITAEKGALANYYAELSQASGCFKYLGVEAAVGGGTRLVAELAGYCRDPENISQLHLVLNGTLTAIFSRISKGYSLNEAVRSAIKAGYAEPGEKDPLAVIRAEAEGDIPKKTAILFNRLGLSNKVLDWRELDFKLTRSELLKSVEEAIDRRFIVSIYKTGNETETDVVGGFHVEHDGWLIVGGFRKVTNDASLGPLASLTGADNGFVIELGPSGTDGTYSLIGPGAGPRPTVNTMLDDYLSLL